MGLARISGKDADALGEEVSSNTLEGATQQTAGQQQERPEANDVWKQLKSVYDPEIPVNIVDLGLVYSMEITEDEESGGHTVRVQMTLTAPGCGMGPAIAEDARAKVMQVPGVKSADVELVWDPAWHQEMISEEGKMQLGLI
jgi:probable FeS assembly SUF system protein SufT